MAKRVDITTPEFQRVGFQHMAKFKIISQRISDGEKILPGVRRWRVFELMQHVIEEDYEMHQEFSRFGDISFEKWEDAMLYAISAATWARHSPPKARPPWPFNPEGTAA